MKISIIVPVYNEEFIISSCLEPLINQDYPKKDYEIVVVNDGSTDSTLKSIRERQKRAKQNRTAFRCINLRKNRGRVIARETGATKAKFQNLLFVDSRCLADKKLLKNIKKINYQPIVGNVIIDDVKSAFDRFAWLVRKKIYRSHFGEKFESVYINKQNFDKIPKGTGIFFCDKSLFLSSQPKDKDKHASDDTKLLYNITQKKDILRHPAPKATYFTRNSLKKTLKHTFERGPKFVDYYLSPSKKYFWVFILTPMLIFLSGLILAITNIKFLLCYIVFLLTSSIITSFIFSESYKDFLITVGLLPLVIIFFELGVIKGLAIKILRRSIIKSKNEA